MAPLAVGKSKPIKEIRPLKMHQHARKALP